MLTKQKVKKILIFLKTLISNQIRKKRYPPLFFLEDITKKHINHNPNIKTKSLDLGCGSSPRNPFQADELFGVDIRKDLEKDIKQANLAIEPIPFESNSFDFITAFDVIEHIPRESWPDGKLKMSFLDLMNEIHRVLKPGGIFLHSTPAYPSPEAFQDPTHVNIITQNTMSQYFCGPTWAKKLGYGFKGEFEEIEQRWRQGIWLVGIMKAIK